MNNDVSQEKIEPDRKFFQISPESIELIADSAGITNLSRTLSTSLAEDTSYRLRQLIKSCSQVLRHSKRLKLTKDDVNLSLRWSDVPEIHGPNTSLEDFVYLPELDIYSSVDRVVDLTLEYPLNTDVEVYSPMKMTIQYLMFDSDDKVKSEIYSQYFEKITQSLLSTSESIVEVALTNLQENSKLQPLLPSFTTFMKSLVAFSAENQHVVGRIPRILNSLMGNPHLHLESEHKSFVDLLQDLLLNYGGPRFDAEIYHLVSRISVILARLSVEGLVHHVVESLGCVVADDTVNIVIQCRALLALRCLGSKYLDLATLEHWNSLLNKFNEVCEVNSDSLYLEDILSGAVVDVLRWKMSNLVNNHDNEESDQLWNEGSEIYRVTSGLLGPSVLRIGEFPISLRQRVQRDRMNNLSDKNNELYWTVKSLRKPSPKSKWQYNLHGTSNKPSAKLKPFDLKEVFDYSERNSCRTSEIVFRVRNWRQRSSSSLKKKRLDGSDKPASKFAVMSNSKFKKTSKCFLVSSVLQFNDPLAMIL